MKVTSIQASLLAGIVPLPGDNLKLNVAGHDAGTLTLGIRGGSGLHSLEASELVADDWRVVEVARANGGFYHDGRFANLQDLVNHYERHFNLRLSSQEAQDLIEFLKAL